MTTKARHPSSTAAALHTVPTCTQRPQSITGMPTVSCDRPGLLYQAPTPGEKGHENTDEI